MAAVIQYLHYIHKKKHFIKVCLTTSNKRKIIISHGSQMRTNCSLSHKLVPDHLFSAFNFNRVIHPLPVLPIKSKKQGFYKLKIQGTKVIRQTVVFHVKILGSTAGCGVNKCRTVETTQCKDKFWSHAT